MKKKLLLTLAALALATVVAPAGAKGKSGTAGAKFDVKPKSLAGTCVDITDGAARYIAEAHLLVFEEYTAQPSCAEVTYTLSVYDTTGSDLIGYASQAGTGEEHRTLEGPTGKGVLRFVVLLDTAYSGASVCLSGTSASGRRVFDRAPDTSCNVIDSDPLGAPGSSPWS